MPVDLHGKAYFTVAERLKMARPDDYEPPRGIRHITTSVTAAGNMVVVRAHVTFEDGQEYSGHSLVNLNATGPAERDAPLETAETSALGRALAFAGWYGSPDGIAGAEELHLAQQRAERRGVMTPDRTPSFPDGSSPVTRVGSGAAPRPVGGGSSNPASPSQVRFATKLWSEAGRPLPPPDFTSYGMRDISALIDELKASAGG